MLLENNTFKIEVCLSNQHQDMVKGVLRLFEIEAEYVLPPPPKSRKLGELHAWIMTQLDELLTRIQPELVLVQGDTTTALAGAQTAFYHQIPIAHVEAGLRTSRLDLPFPEEANRRLISQLANYHFPPTQQAADNLLREGIAAGNMLLTGNTGIDALKCILLKSVQNPGSTILQLKNKLDTFLSGQLFGLATMHRRENLGEPLDKFCQLLIDLHQQTGLHLVFPVHPNPTIKEKVEASLKDHPGILLLPALAYDVFIWLMQESYLILTDSGGIQEEATVLGKPVLLFRRETERPEGLVSGNVIAIDFDKKEVIQEVVQLQKDQVYYKKRSSKESPFGDGKASERIVQFLKILSS
ncbi:MAG: UDP-N-acetylglucosamine 2-epimerase [Saprospiraceae bacterium]|nr:MAG: UDP-N-acetylglucosamine 2-epimerase [Saprospiraceae bacterium]